MDELREILPLLIPLLVIQLLLVIAAVVDLVRRDKTRGPKWLWALIIVFVNLIGPIIYFLAAREDE